MLTDSRTATQIPRGWEMRRGRTEKPGLFAPARAALGLGEPEALPGPRLTAEQMPPGGCWELVAPTSSPSWPPLLLRDPVPGAAVREDQREDVSAGCVVT